jgi:nucleotide-binding universal stress UspA family protein
VCVVCKTQQLGAANFTTAANMQDVPPVDIASMNNVVELQMEEARAYLAEVTSKIQSERISAKCEGQEGTATEVIFACAREKDIDTIVISSHGPTGLRRLVSSGVLSK